MVAHEDLSDSPQWLCDESLDYKRVVEAFYLLCSPYRKFRRNSTSINPEQLSLGYCQQAVAAAINCPHVGCSSVHV
jgi:hypothetical protein